MQKGMLWSQKKKVTKNEHVKSTQIFSIRGPLPVIQGS